MECIHPLTFLVTPITMNSPDKPQENYEFMCHMQKRES